ncbi:MAG: small multi-drug export protein [Methanotrichaceae archaeon]|nr:small multi-drug export protein [Methanotrichaceae archaeon]
MIPIASNWIITLIFAALPISEVRGAIPLAIGVYGFSAVDAYLLAVLGNLLPVIPLLLFLEPISDYLMRYPAGNRFFTWLFSRTRRKYIQDRENFSMIALAIFVAIPLPMTGAWTGCAIAFLIGMKFRNALIAIASGVLVAGAIVTTTVMSIKLLAF